MVNFSIILIANIAIFAAIGRLFTPPREPLPLSEWALTELFPNFRRGLEVCAPRYTELNWSDQALFIPAKAQRRNAHRALHALVPTFFSGILHRKQR